MGEENTLKKVSESYLETRRSQRLGRRTLLATRWFIIVLGCKISRPESVNIIFLGNRHSVIQGLLTSGLVLSVYDFIQTHVMVPSVWFDCVYDCYIISF